MEVSRIMVPDRICLTGIRDPELTEEVLMKEDSSELGTFVSLMKMDE